MPSSPYVLMTAAKNEAAYIEKTIQSVIRQTQKPLFWVIVSDGSTDGTDAIVRRYMIDHPFITLIRKDGKDGLQGFASKAKALQIAYASLKPLPFDFIGNLDADISLERAYYQRIMEKFKEDPRLGLAGGVIFDSHSGKWRKRFPDKDYYVSGGIQFFRRVCFEGIGEYPALKHGGEDTVMAVKARMGGWRVAMFPEFSVFHHKVSLGARGGLAEKFREGAMFYTLGSYFFFELGKSLFRMKEKPYLLGGAARTLGYLAAFMKGRPSVVDGEFIRFFREEQRCRLKEIIFGAKGKMPEPKILSETGPNRTSQ